MLRTIRNLHTFFTSVHNFTHLLHVVDDVDALLLAQHALPLPGQFPVIGVLELDRALLEGGREERGGEERGGEEREEAGETQPATRAGDTT